MARNFGRIDQPRGEKEFEEKVVQVNRVSKKTKGGNKIGFSVLVVVGDKKGRVGVGLGKAPDVSSAIAKGAAYAKKHLITVTMKHTTIPHEILVKRGASLVLLKPVAPGTGVIAGGAVRAVVEAAGIRDIVSKILGSANQASNVYATLEALSQLRSTNEAPPTSRSGYLLPTLRRERNPSEAPLSGAKGDRETQKATKMKDVYETK